MATAATPRKTVSIHDYPEHLNPFREDDNHNKIRFWTLGKKLTRSNSINFSGLKDIRNSWTLRSFMKKGKKNDTPVNNKPSPTQVNGETSPIVFRRAAQYSSASTISPNGTRGSLATPERPDRYVYGGSITPLPRSRFQERLRSPSHQEVNTIRNGDQGVIVTPRLARSEISDSRLSVGSTNPFDEEPVPPVRASRRKKKRAPPPPPVSANTTGTSTEFNFSVVSEINDSKESTGLEDDLTTLNIELKIIEEKDIQNKETNETKASDSGKLATDKTSVEVNIQDGISTQDTKTDTEVSRSNEHLKDQPDDIEEDVFPKVNIRLYRRNSSMNEDDIRLRRNNNDFSPLENRSKSLTNELNTNQNYTTYDINLNTEQDDAVNDVNGNAQRVICKYDEIPRKQSVETTSSTEREFNEIDRATKELEREISKLNSALEMEEPVLSSTRMSVTEMKKKFDNSRPTSPNPIPKPRRTNAAISP